MNEQRQFIRRSRDAFDPERLSSDELKILRSMIKHRKRRNFNIDFSVSITVDFAFAMKLATVLQECYHGNDYTILRFAEQILKEGQEYSAPSEDDDQQDFG